MRRQSSGINCLLAVDKPLGLTSHDVVARARRILSERRVGHAGTLDPAASGVLVLGVGQATRLMGMLTLDDKRYEARIAFGTQTTTDDTEGEVVLRAEVPERLGEEAVAAAVVASLVGPCAQVPPAYSAISVDGKRAYDRARAGEDVELPTRQVTIHEAELLGVGEQDGQLVWDCAFHVSKGTYIRSIARDLGQSMGTAAHLCALRRTASGPVTLEDCLTLEGLEQLGSAAASAALDPVRVLGHPWHELNDYERQAVAVGRQFGCRTVVDARGRRRPPHEGERISLVDGDNLMGVWEERNARLACVANFPGGIAGVR